MSNEDYFEFFKNMFEIWINDTERVELKQIIEIYEEFIKCLEPRFSLRKCSCSNNCFENFISLDMDGELYSCNRNYNNKEFYYGNIENLDIQELIYKMKEMSRQRQEYILSSKCKECSLFEECKGGCPANAYIQHGTMYSSDDYFCVANIKIKEYVNKRIKELNLKDEYTKGLREKSNVFL